MELLVRTRNRLEVSTQRWISSAAPGIGWFSCTSTPSMSVSQHSISWPLRYTDDVDRTSSESERWSVPWSSYWSAMVPSADSVPLLVPV